MPDRSACTGTDLWHGGLARHLPFKDDSYGRLREFEVRQC
jgi:hypothetical protein